MDHRFSQEKIDGVYQAIYERRDIREFTQEKLPEGLMDRLFHAAHFAPSVGYMQPWRMIHIKSPEIRQQVADLVEAERQSTASQLPSRQQEFLKLKIEGLASCQEIVVIALMQGREAHIFGRRTMPEMDLASAACAIQNMWLAARAEGAGLGWVSFFEPEKLAKLLKMPEGATPIAILCIGSVAQFPEKPLLDILGWGKRLPMEQVVFTDLWPEDAPTTPPAY